MDNRKRFAVKVIRARDNEYQKVALKEFKLLKTLNHPGIIKMQEAFVNNAKETIYLVMELIEGECLRSFVENYLLQNPEKKSNIGGLPY